MQGHDSRARIAMRQEADCRALERRAGFQRQEEYERHVIIAAEKRARTLLEGLIRS
jgi:hypothetical protein